MSFSAVYPMLNVCWHFYFLRRLSDQLGHRLHHCAFRFDGVMWRRMSLHLLFFVFIASGSWNCFCSFWSANALIIVICTMKFRLSLMLFCIYSANFSYSDDNNDFSLNVVKYGLWSMEWDSWYLNSVCWFSFFPSRVFTEVSHHCWGPRSDKIWGRVLFCCLKAFFVLFLAFLHGVPCAERYIHRILYPGSIFALFSVWWVCAALRAACATLATFKLLGVWVN